ncbi:MAG: DNA polymerase III subunit delta [Thermodesulfobacteriota bacterium]
MSARYGKPIYYICGTDDYRIEEAVSSIRQEALSGGFESMNYQCFEGKGLDAGELLAACSTMPAFSDRRLVVVKDAGSIKADQAKALASYIASPSPTTCLVFIAEGKAQKSSALYKALDRKGFVEVLNRLGDRELAGWVVKEARGQGKSITPDAAARLVLIAGTRLRDVKGELDKVVLYIGDKKGVDVSDIEDSGLDCREETIYALSDAIGSKDAKKAFAVYEKISGEEPLVVLSSIIRQIRMLLKAKALLKKGVRGRNFSAELGVFYKYAEDYARRSRLFTEKELCRAVFLLRTADTDLKTGRLPRSTVLPGLISELCAKRG